MEFGHWHAFVSIAVVAHSAGAKVSATPWSEAEGATGPNFLFAISAVAFQNAATIGTLDVKVRRDNEIDERIYDRFIGRIYD